MFSSNKTVVCIEFAKNSVFCALAQISGKKVDIVAIDSINIESGILEDGIIYDAPHLQQIVKNLVTSVSKSHNKLDTAWISVPDNKILITKFDVDRDKKGVNDEDLHRAIEEKFNHSASKLYLINRPIQELNRKVFFLSNAVRVDHLEPFIELFEPLNIPVEAVIPTFQCIYEELKDQFIYPTLLLYPSEKGYKFFLADSSGVHLESVWGHNVIEFNENFDKAIGEIVQYAKQSKDVALGIKKIAIIESSKFDSEVIQSYIQKTGIEYNWIAQPANSDNNFDSVQITVLKGLIKSCMANEFNKGFLEPQLTQELDYKLPVIPLKQLDQPNISTHQSITPAYTTPVTSKTMNKSDLDLDSNWNWKAILAAVLVAVGVIGLLSYVGIKLSNKIGKKTGQETVQNTNPTPIPSATLTPSIATIPTTEPTAQPTETPTATALPELQKKDIKVLVRNGNNVDGQAREISSLIQAQGFIMKAPQNNPVKNVPSTTVTYKDPRAENLAKEVAKIIQTKYPSANAVLDDKSTEDILVVLGVR